MRHSVRALFRVTALAALFVLPASRVRAEAAPDPDEAVDQVTQMNRDAVAAYQAKKYEEARKILKQALDLAGQAGLDKHPITARTHVHFGIVAIVGFKQRDLGIKQFKKAIEIQSDIGLTKALVSPELTDAFNEAKSGASAPPPPATPATPPPEPPKSPEPPPKAPASEPEVSGSGLVHEPVSEGKQGSAISVTVGVSNDLQFEKIILAYRPEGASEFLGREMKEVADGRYGAEIPTSATMGGAVAYYVEAEDADGAPVAARGSVDNPLTIRLLGVGVSRKEDEDEDEDENEENPEHRYFVAMLAGTGAGYATGSGDLNRDLNVNPAGLAMAGVGQIAPEFGYWLNSSLMLSLQLRYEYISGTTDIYETTPRMCPDGHCHTANYAFAAFAKATWKFGGEAKFHPFFSLAAGGGRIRHVVSFSNQKYNNCGPNHNEGCIDTIGAGPVLIGPGGGLMYDINDRLAALVQVNSVLAFPDFTAHVDGNLGLAYAF